MKFFSMNITPLYNTAPPPQPAFPAMPAPSKAIAKNDYSVTFSATFDGAEEAIGFASAIMYNIGELDNPSPDLMDVMRDIK